MPILEPIETLTGRLLVATPVLAGTEFAQTVIYLCAHSAEDGAMGMIVNRRLTHPDISALLRHLDVSPNPPQRLFGVGVGGPVEPGRGFVLHSPEGGGLGRGRTGSRMTVLPDEPPVAEVSASIEMIRELAAGRGPRQAMLLLGHAAWAAGQLEEEILHGNAWYVVPADEDIVFGADPSTKWQRALESVGLEPSSLTASVGEA
ncbi:hypothetical protein CO583_08815 [Parasaccharibacter sp. TMW2.1882]|uniref:UPF0301 protein ASQ42_07610 n=1 Tax=Parasaccharibacter apium TaxID=1510841 RepID=A0A7U7J073_9PROT|nr:MULTISPECIES: YqgE/AlgH family protein [Acetobacteraceae]MCL1563230.1 hypothetical protein [Parasaccharibacter sp. TMW 2.1886]MCQ0042156.1 YqgE/AlgH family protein [Bombella sp.]MUG80070.1 hypothetical protein [Bombella sp. ESL0380]MUH03421.1 hypothetical protein [Bombella sp. ESL0387]QGT75651.1 hypothetical protein GN304_07915 [Bombella sp. ESL0368]